MIFPEGGCVVPYHFSSGDEVRVVALPPLFPNHHLTLHCAGCGGGATVVPRH